MPLRLKVVMIGDPGSYEDLAHEHPQFLRTFKVHAEFASSVANDAAHRRAYADYARLLTQLDAGLELTAEANAGLVEFGVRAAGRKDELTTHFGELADVVREATFLARQRGAEAVHRADVDLAVRAREHRLDLVREHSERELRHGYIDVPVDGEAVGVCTVMTVLDSGTFAFGKPAVVSAASGAGIAGPAHVVNIEREASLSGPLHDKGVLALTGFLIDQFGRDGILCMQATVCVDQVYGGIDGDSASAAELMALLSSLSRVPLRRGLAVSGSVTQRGDVQAVGGINEKIEGWFRWCRQSGLDGTQGVVLPAANVEDLHLAEDVCRAVDAGEFRVHAVRHIHEVLDLMATDSAERVLGAAGATLRRFRDAAAEHGSR